MLDRRRRVPSARIGPSGAPLWRPVRFLGALDRQTTSSDCKAGEAPASLPLNEDGPRHISVAGRLCQDIPVQLASVFFSVARVAGRPALRGLASRASRRR